MDTSTISCPKCSHEFRLTEAVTRSIEDELRQKYEADDAKRQQTLKQKLAELELRDQAIKDKTQEFDRMVREQVEQQKKQIVLDEQQRATDASASAVQELREKLALREKLLDESRNNELALRKQRDEFEETRKSFELEKARLTDDIKTSVARQKDEEIRLKEAEYKKLIDDLKHQMDEVKRKAEQGSQQAQGEILELELEATIKQVFPTDEMRPVPKGEVGADVIQAVFDNTRRECGSIIWEIKRTKAWSEGWLGKLRDDKRASRADVAIIVSTALPKDLQTFEFRDGVWITPPSLAIALAAALRGGLMSTAAARRQAETRTDKQSQVYDYLCSTQFRDRVGAVVETFAGQLTTLNKERAAYERIWATRQKEIERAMKNLAAMWGDLGGLIGTSLPNLPALDVPMLE